MTDDSAEQPLVEPKPPATVPATKPDTGTSSTGAKGAQAGDLKKAGSGTQDKGTSSTGARTLPKGEQRVVTQDKTRE